MPSHKGERRHYLKYKIASSHSNYAEADTISKLYGKHSISWQLENEYTKTTGNKDSWSA